MSVVLKEFVFLRVQQFFRVNVEGLVAVFGIFLMTLGFRVALKICLRAGGGGDGFPLFISSKTLFLLRRPPY